MKPETRQAIEEARKNSQTMINTSCEPNLVRSVYQYYEHALTLAIAEIEELKAERVCPKEGCKHWAEETDVENREITEWCNYKGICNRMAFDQFKPKEDKNEKA